MSEQVNHPKHYNIGTIEVIDVIEDWSLGFHLGNALKYIARAKHKGNELQDLKKAKWYVERAWKKHYLHYAPDAETYEIARVIDDWQLTGLYSTWITCLFDGDMADLFYSLHAHIDNMESSNV